MVGTNVIESGLFPLQVYWRWRLRLKNDMVQVPAQLAAACEPVWEPHKADIHSCGEASRGT